MPKDLCSSSSPNYQQNSSSKAGPDDRRDVGRIQAYSAQILALHGIVSAYHKVFHVPTLRYTRSSPRLAETEKGRPFWLNPVSVSDSDSDSDSQRLRLRSAKGDSDTILDRTHGIGSAMAEVSLAPICLIFPYPQTLAEFVSHHEC
jgi:hypothetical protein